MDFFHHGAPPPPFPSHLASAYCMYYALGVFAAVYEYTCPFTPLSRSSPPSPLPPPLPPLPPPASSLFSLPASLQLPSWQTGKQTASFGPVLSLGVASSHSSQHGHTHTQRHTNANMLTPVQHHKLRGEYPLTQIRTHWSRPPWNNSGESQVNVTACKGQTARNVHTKAHRQCSCLNTRLS